MLESCISLGFLIGGMAFLSHQELLAFWQQTEARTTKPTLDDVLGPFFRKGAPNNPKLRAPDDQGFPLKVTGRVMNIKGQLMEGAKLDLWHADHSGRYHKTGYK